MLCSSISHAAARYWVGTSGANWNTTASWSASSGGASGASVPGSADTAIFNGSAATNCTINANVNVNRIRMASGYTGTISQNAYTVTVAAGGFIVTSGTFSGSSSTITLSGTLTINGGTFTSTSGTLSTTSGITFSSGTFTHNSGTVELKATATLSGSPAFYNFSVAPTAAVTTITISNTPVVNNTFTLGGTQRITLNTGTLNCKGNIVITNSGTAGGGSATVNISGTTTQTLTGSGTEAQGVLPKITVNKSSDTLKLQSIVSLAGDWTHTAGVVSPGSSTLCVCGSISFMGSSFSLNHFMLRSTFSVGVSASQVLTVLGNFTAYSSLIGGTGVIDLKGNMTINSSGTTSTYTGNVHFTGNGNQTLTGSGSAFTGYLPNVRIGKHPGDTLFLAGTITQTGTWDLDSGVVRPGSSTMCITNTDIYGTQNWNNLVIASGAGSNIAAADTLRVLGDLTFNTTGSTVSLGGGTLHAKGNITMQHTGANTATQTATIRINGTGNQTLTGNGTAGTGMFCNLVIDKPSGTLYLASIITVRGNWTYTGGTVDATTHTASVAFYGNSTVDAQGSSSTMSFYNAQVYRGTVTLAGNIRTVNNFQIASFGTPPVLSAGSYTVFVGGTWNNSGTFTPGTSTVTFEGSGYRAIKKASTALETFYNLTLNRTFEAGSALLLNTPIKVTNTLTLTKGKIKANRTGGTPFYFELADNATVSGGGDSAFVYGPLRKTGNDTFSFPLGDTLTTVGAYHPVSISAPGSATDQFEAEYIGKTANSSGYSTGSFDTTLAAVSTCGFWKLQRKAGSSNVVATISANSNSTCDDPDINEMRIAAWDTTGTDHWKDLGDASRAVFNNLVSVSSTASITLPMTTDPIPIASAKKANNIVYATLRKKLDGGYFQIANAQLYFRYDEEYNDTDGKLTFNVYNDNHTKITSSSIIGPASLIPSIAYGDNRCHLNMFGCYVLNGGGFLTSGFYILEVINEKNEKWYLRFKNTNGIAVPACSNTWGS